jgi:hypothetical protein
VVAERVDLAKFARFDFDTFAAVFAPCQTAFDLKDKKIKID